MKTLYSRYNPYIHIIDPSPSNVNISILFVLLDISICLPQKKSTNDWCFRTVVGSMYGVSTRPEDSEGKTCNGTKMPVNKWQTQMYRETTDNIAVNPWEISINVNIDFWYQPTYLCFWKLSINNCDCEQSRLSIKMCLCT